MTPRRATAIELAGEIAAAICATAISYDGECTWMGTVQRRGTARGTAQFSYESLGPDFYAGTAGVALFLAEWHSRSGDTAAAEVSVQAARFAAANLDRLHRKFRRSYYSGRLGIAHTLMRVSALLDNAELRDIAVREIDRQLRDTDEDILLDVISGAAGTIGPALALAADLGRPDLLSFAIRLGDRIVAAANSTEIGLAWGENSTGFSTKKPLTGLGHGAGGMGWALHELAAATGEPRFRDAAQGAFRYERSLFSITRGNWPDLRYSSDTSDTGSFGVAWCLGAPGIALTRMRAAELEGPSIQHTADVDAALRAISGFAEGTLDTGIADFSLCHGWAGLGDILLSIIRHRPSAVADALIDRIVGEGAIANHGQPHRWRCGMERGSTPAMMLGLAGIGYFFLRVADPMSVPSVLLVHAQSSAG